jgi:hypothetical protein
VVRLLALRLLSNYVYLTDNMGPGPSFKIVGLHSTSEETKFSNLFSNSVITRFSPERPIIEIGDAIVDSFTGIARHKSRLIAESSSWPPQREIAANPEFFLCKPTAIIAGPVIVMPSSPYYHWLLEDVPAFVSALRANPAASVVAHKNAPSYVRDFMELLEISPVLSTGSIEAETLVFSSKVGIIGTPQKHDIDIVRGISGRLLQNVNHRDRRIYVSRRKSARSLPNEIEVESQLEARGFEVVFSEDLTWIQQVQIFAEASLVIGPHGAGLANAVFMEPGSVLIEILQDSYPNNCFEILARKAHLEFNRVMYSDEEQSISRLILAALPPE